MTEPIKKTADMASKTVGKAGKVGLGKQVGPLPVGVWIAVIGGGLVISFYISSRNSKKTVNNEGQNTQAPSALVYTGTGNATGSDLPESTTTGGYQTNEQWGTAAKQWLISQGYDGSEASTAVDLYINAQALNAKQNAMIALAIKAIGATPQSLPPTTGTPTPQDDPYTKFQRQHVDYATSTAGGKSLVGTVYTVQAGDTIDAIARKAYAIASGDYSNLTFAMNQIQNNNWDKLPDIKNIAQGTTIYIPVISSQEFPNFGSKIPLLGWKGPGTNANEWEFATGIVPQSAQQGRTGH